MQMFSSKLQLSSTTVKFFHLKQLALYGSLNLIKQLAYITYYHKHTMYNLPHHFPEKQQVRIE